MRTTIRLSLILAVVATAGLVAVPAASAKPRAAELTDAEKADEKKQNRALNRAGRRIDRAGKRIDGLKDYANGLAIKNEQQDGKLTTVQGTVNTIVAGVPAIVDGLTQLKDGLLTLKGVLENTVGPGLTALKTGLETLAGAYTAVEYGVAKVFATNGTVAAGSTVTSADVPDDGNVADANNTAIVVATGTPMSINLRADIRSNEEDNDSGDTVGQAGGFIYVKSTQQSFTDNDADVDSADGDSVVDVQNRDATETVVQRVACTGAPNPPGIFGTSTGASIVTPSGTVTNLNLVNLPGGFERTDTTHPDSASTSLLPAACSFTATPGAVYEVYYNVSFVDIPTTTTPGGTE